MRDPRGDVDFEISFFALLATVAIYISSSSIAHEQIVEVSAIGLLFLTLVRRISYMNGLSTRHPIFPLTTYVMSSISYFVSIYILYCATELLTSLITSVDTFNLFLIISITSPILILLLQEATIGGFMSETQRIFETISLESEIEFIKFVGKQLARVSEKGRTGQSDYTMQKEISDFSKSRSLSEVTPEQRRVVYGQVIGSTLGFTAGFLLYGAVALLLGYIFQVSIFLSVILTLAVLMVTGPIDIWLSRYGIVPMNNTSEWYKGLAAIVGIVISFIILPVGL